jgi:hypothetical protein
VSAPIFNIGDKVECESDIYEQHPRWDYLDDSGGSGKYIQGTVAEIDGSYMVVRFDHTTWQWPLFSHPDYRDNQWNQPGYLRHVRSMRGNTVRHPGKWRLVDKGNHTAMEKVE